MKVLVVCLGNVNRSPACEAVLRAEGMEVRSAGLSEAAGRGYRAAKKTRDMLQRRGYDLSEHRSQRLEPEHLHWADVVICMTPRHQDRVLAEHVWPPSTRLVNLGTYIGLPGIKDPGFMRRDSVEFLETTDQVIRASLAFARSELGK